MELRIRRALKADASKIIKAHQRSIREVCSKDYSKEQITAWSGRDFQESIWHRTFEDDFVWVIADSSENIYGFGHLRIKNESAELMGLYYVPEVIGFGYGKQMISLMRNECIAKSIHSIFLTGTKTAKSFYEAVGFKQVGEEKLVPIGGEPLEVFEMQMQIDQINLR